MPANTWSCRATELIDWIKASSGEVLGAAQPLSDFDSKEAFEWGRPLLQIIRASI